MQAESLFIDFINKQRIKPAIVLKKEIENMFNPKRICCYWLKEDLDMVKESLLSFK